MDLLEQYASLDPADDSVVQPDWDALGPLLLAAIEESLDSSGHERVSRSVAAGFSWRGPLVAAAAFVVVILVGVALAVFAIVDEPTPVATVPPTSQPAPDTTQPAPEPEQEPESQADLLPREAAIWFAEGSGSAFVECGSPCATPNVLTLADITHSGSGPFTVTAYTRDGTARPQTVILPEDGAGGEVVDGRYTLYGYQRLEDGDLSPAAQALIVDTTGEYRGQILLPFTNGSSTAAPVDGIDSEQDPGWRIGDVAPGLGVSDLPPVAGFDIVADGDWAIGVYPMWRWPTLDRTLSGVGDAVIWMDSSVCAVASVEARYEGDGRFLALSVTPGTERGMTRFSEVEPGVFNIDFGYGVGYNPWAWQEPEACSGLLGIEIHADGRWHLAVNLADEVSLVPELSLAELLDEANLERSIKPRNTGFEENSALDWTQRESGYGGFSIAGCDQGLYVGDDYTDTEVRPHEIAYARYTALGARAMQLIASGTSRTTEALFDEVSQYLTRCVDDLELWFHPDSLEDKSAYVLELPSVADEQHGIRYVVADGTMDVRFAVLRAGKRLTVVEIHGPYPTVLTDDEFHEILRVATARLDG